MAGLPARLNPDAPLAKRHRRLSRLPQGVRGDRRSAPVAVARLQQFIEAVQARPESQRRLQAWWSRLLQTIEVTALLADFGFATRTAFFARAGRAPAQQALAGHTRDQRRCRAFPPALAQPL